jgi:hypothetical protein
MTVQHTPEKENSLFKISPTLLFHLQSFIDTPVVAPYETVLMLFQFHQKHQ